MKTEFKFTIPQWLKELKLNLEHVFSDKEKMKLAIKLSALNVQNRTGGPFGAAVFNIDTSKLISVGTNIVIPQQWACGHAEIVALTLADATMKTNDISTKGNFELYSSAEPCTMCMGAVIWSGVKKLVCAAKHEDIQSIGFDEGPKPKQWPEEFKKRKIEVTRNFMRKEAIEVLNNYKKNGGNIYNASSIQK